MRDYENMKLFVSYSRVDKPICKAIVERLSAHDVWFDQNLYGGENWWQKIEREIFDREGFVYLLSNDSVVSEYCIKEFETALELGKQIIPVIVRARTEIPTRLESLKNFQQVDYSEQTINSVTDLLNAVLIAERISNQNVKNPNSVINTNLTFNYAYLLEKQEKLSNLTRSTYFRWIDNFLVTVASYEPSYGEQRKKRMGNLPIKMLVSSLKIVHVRTWINMVASSKRSTSAVVQAKAAIKQLIAAMIEQGHLDPMLLQQVDAVPTPSASVNKTSYRYLSLKEIEDLIQSSLMVATSDHQARRNKLLMLMFCYLLMRPSDIANLRWETISIDESDQTLLFRKPEAHLTIQAPTSMYFAYQAWRNSFPIPSETSFNSTLLIRAIRQGGLIADQGISPRGILQIVARAASQNNLGEVTPLDIRQSIAQMMVKEKILSIDVVSRLFGHARGRATVKLFDKTQAEHISEIITIPEFLNLAF